MDITPPLPVEFIDQPARLDLAAREMKGSREIALDTESNSFHRYPEQLCLIQVATRHQVFLIDPIALKDLVTFKEVLADRSVLKIAHGADYDVRSLDRYGGCRIRNLYDTSLAARFAGLAQFGLAALLQDLLGITLDKSKRLQRADWGRRPLSAEALAYAASDVGHLAALRKILDQRLGDLKRTAWVAEECARLEEVRFTPPDLENGYLTIKGARVLDGRGLAVLKELAAFREKEAVRQGRPHFYVLPDASLIFMAANLKAPLKDVPGLGGTNLLRYERGLRQALRDGLAAPPVQRPRPPARRFSYQQIQLHSQRLTRLKAWRTEQGAALSLDPSLLWPAASLERLAEDPKTLGEELGSEIVRNWQRDQFAASLRLYLDTLV
jgi:ribonuclease D